MKIAFSKPTAGEQEQHALFSRFRAAGYDGLQLKAGQYLPYLRAPETFSQRWGTDPGSSSALIAMGTLDPDGTDKLRQIIQFARDVSAERIVFCHGTPREGLTDDDIRGFARRLSEIGHQAGDQGVALSLHHHYNQPVMHRKDFDTFFDAADPQAVHLTVDTAHLVKSEVTDVARLVADLHPVIDNLHVKDFADGEFRLLGEGTLDLDALFETLIDVGYDGWICVDEESGADLDHGLNASIEYLRAGLQRATGQA